MKELRTRAILLDSWLREAFCKRQEWHRRHLAATLLFFAEGKDASLDPGFLDQKEIRDGSLLSQQQDDDSDEEGQQPTTNGNQYENEQHFNNGNNGYDNDNSGGNSNGGEYIDSNGGEYSNSGGYSNGGGYDEDGGYNQEYASQEHEGPNDYLGNSSSVDWSTHAHSGKLSIGEFGVHETSRSKTPTRQNEDEHIKVEMSTHQSSGLQYLEKHKNNQSNTQRNSQGNSNRPSRSLSPARGGTRSRGNTLMPPPRSSSAVRSMANKHSSTNRLPIARGGGNNQVSMLNMTQDNRDNQEYNRDNNQDSSSMKPGHRGLRSLRTSRSCSPSSREPPGPPKSPRDANSYSSTSTVGSDVAVVYGDEAISALDGNSDDSDDDRDINGDRDDRVDGDNDDINYIEDSDYNDNDDDEDDEEGEGIDGYQHINGNASEGSPAVLLKLKSTLMAPDGVTPIKKRNRRLTPSASAFSGARGALKKSPALQRHIMLFTGTDREAVHASHGSSWGVPEDVSRFTRCA